MLMTKGVNEPFLVTTMHISKYPSSSNRVYTLWLYPTTVTVVYIARIITFRNSGINQRNKYSIYAARQGITTAYSIAVNPSGLPLAGLPMAMHSVRSTVEYRFES